MDEWEMNDDELYNETWEESDMDDTQYHKTLLYK